MNPAKGTLPCIRIGERKGLSLSILPRDSRTVGSIIVRPDAHDLIEGIRIHPLQVFPDDRGFFAELARLGSGLTEGFAETAGARIQVSATLSYPGAIKAIHYHYEQTDIWCPMEGMLQVCLCDFRRESRTFGSVNTLYLGRYQPEHVRVVDTYAYLWAYGSRSRMNPKGWFLLLVAAGVLVAAQPAEAGKITAADAKKHVGEYVQVCGKVAGTRYSPSTHKLAPTFLDLDNPHPHQPFTVVIRGDARSKFDEPEKTFRDKDICVTGRVETDKGVPQIAVSDANQIKVK